MQHKLRGEPWMSGAAAGVERRLAWRAGPDYPPDFSLITPQGEGRRSSRMIRGMGGIFHLFTLAGVPVSATPWFAILLFMFARGSAHPIALTVGICIGLFVHEMGHALVARYLRRSPSIVLHGFGGLTHHEPTARAVEEATLTAMGPAAGLLFALVIGGGLLALLYGHGARYVPFLASRAAVGAVSAFLWPSIAWNLFNLVPVWPLDGGHLFRLGATRVLGARRGDVVTHVLSLLLLAVYLAFVIRSSSGYWLILPALIAWQNVQALRGEISSGTVYSPVQSGGPDLVKQARKALDEGRDRDAVRLAQQTRAGAKLSAPVLDEVWAILGVGNTRLAEHEEALSYLRRARPSAEVREATEACLAELGQGDELEQIRARWAAGVRGRYMGRVLVGTLAFIGTAIALLLLTPLRLFM
jgi:stage IV sporulation protein FB